jgi:hypothetical protein
MELSSDEMTLLAWHGPAKRQYLTAGDLVAGEITTFKSFDRSGADTFV